MYHVIALKDTGAMVVFANYEEEPDCNTLKNDTERFNYTQLLVVGANDYGDGMQLARYVLESGPAVLRKTTLG